MNHSKHRPRYARALLLFALTCISTTYVGAGEVLDSSDAWIEGLTFSVPLLGILLAHEFGHYFAARLHAVPSSLPYFIPLPIGPLGTLGAVIVMPNRIAKRDALLDIGAAGPLAGMCVAIPILVYGLTQSEIGPIDMSQPYLQEGHSLLYKALLYLTKGPMPAGHDIQLNATAFAGWVGLLVTMINLIPAAQLDGGHVAYALFGAKQQYYSRYVRRALLPLGLLVCLGYGLPAYLDGSRGEVLWAQASAGIPWLLWTLLLRFMVRRTPYEHPPTDGSPLSPKRQLVAWGTLALFVLLFMPSWLRHVLPA